jgi:glycosyltransferase 2 family protein
MPHRRIKPVLSEAHQRKAQDLRSYLTGYFWWIAKNVIGWALILAAWPVGILVPGPGGLPLFLIGFAMVAFPGKRRLTSRFMRGKPFDLEARVFTILVTVISIMVTVGVTWVLVWYYQRLIGEHDDDYTAFVGVAVLALVITYAVMWLLLRGVNLFIRTVPMGRRMIRPWLRRKGVRLLPTRRKRVHSEDGTVIVESREILEFDQRHHERMSRLWTFLKTTLKRAIGIGITVLIFYFILKPLWEEWDTVRPRIGLIDWPRFAVGALLFAVFLFVFRALLWRELLALLGHRIPVAPATRIWQTSELARYLPGVIWQVVGRVWLVRPYGVRGSVCSTSQVLELLLFLLANVLVAVACLLFFGYRAMEGAARFWLLASMALVPVLAIVIHPAVFRPIVRRLMQAFKKPDLSHAPSTRWMYLLLAWSVLGLLFQGIAVWLSVGSPLGLVIDKWWVVAGAYCLAWIAGFLAIWAPGGLGVRELVFVLAVSVALPDSVRATFASDGQQRAFLAFLAVLLRLWATAGELLVAGIAYGVDWRGAIGDPTAPGRVPNPPPPEPDSPIVPVDVRTPTNHPPASVSK